MWASYRDQKRWLHQEKYQGKCGEQGLESTLWHGTGNTPPADLVFTNTGWDMSYACNANRFGAGSYFAKYPHYPDRYRFRWSGEGVKKLIMADVLTGAIRLSCRSRCAPKCCIRSTTRTHRGQVNRKQV